MKRQYRDFYGCSASISEHNDDTATLKVRLGNGKLIKNSTHKNFKAARSAMQRMSDGWEETRKAKTA